MSADEHIAAEIWQSVSEHHGKVDPRRSALSAQQRSSFVESTASYREVGIIAPTAWSTSTEFVTARLPKSLKPERSFCVVRLGAGHDGGYIIPVGALAAKHLLTLGLNLEWSFEREFARRATRLQSLHCYDHTVKPMGIYRRGAINLWKVCVLSRPSKRLPKVRIALDYALFFQLGMATHLQLASAAEDGPGKRSVTSAIAALGPDVEDGSVLLKCDIEGCEYEVIDQFVDNAPKLMAIVLELHDVATQSERFRAAMKKLQERYAIVHIHANNFAPVSPEGVPECVEVTLVNRTMMDALDRLDAGSTDGLQVTRDAETLDLPNNPQAAPVLIEYI
jgi:hypothetical protein